VPPGHGSLSLLATGPPGTVPPLSNVELSPAFQLDIITREYTKEEEKDKDKEEEDREQQFLHHSLALYRCCENYFGNLYSIYTFSCILSFCYIYYI